MWQSFLQQNYSDREEWLRYSDTYGLAERLGYHSAEAAWDDDPFIQGSTNPADFGLADLQAYYGKRMRRWSPEKLEKEDVFAGRSVSDSDPAKEWRAAIDKELQRRGLTSSQ